MRYGPRSWWPADNTMLLLLDSRRCASHRIVVVERNVRFTRRNFMPDNACSIRKDLCRLRHFAKKVQLNVQLRTTQLTSKPHFMASSGNKSGGRTSHVARRPLVSQALFDAAVEENVTEFGLDRAAAIAAAIEQFIATGGDITGVVATVEGSTSHPVVAALARVRVAATAAASSIDGSDASGDPLLELIQALHEFTTECDAAPEHRSIAASHGAVATVADIVATAAKSCDLLGAGASALRSLALNHDANRAAVPLAVLNTIVDGMFPSFADGRAVHAATRRCVCFFFSLQYTSRTASTSNGVLSPRHTFPSFDAARALAQARCSLPGERAQSSSCSTVVCPKLS